MSNVETPTPHAQVAATIDAQLRAIMSSVSGFGFVTKGERRRLAASASVPDAFLLQVAQALDAMPDIALAAKVQPSELRDAVNFTQAFAPLAAALQLYARGLLETIATHRSEAGGKALRVYTLAKSFDRPSQAALAVPHVRDMKITLKRGRPRRSTPVDPETLPGASDPMPQAA